jgi:hypothetical protein
MLRARNLQIFLGPYPANDSAALQNLIIKDNSGTLI